MRPSTYPGSLLVSVEAATRRELDKMRADELSPALYALALSDAALIDASSAARDKASLSKELREVRAELVELHAARVAAEGEGDGVDDLESRRAARRSAQAAVGT